MNAGLEYGVWCVCVFVFVCKRKRETESDRDRQRGVLELHPSQLV